MFEFTLKKATTVLLILLVFLLNAPTPSGRQSESGIIPNLEPGIIKKVTLPKGWFFTHYPGLTFWTNNVLIKWWIIEPDSEIPLEQLPADRVMVVWKGAVEQLVEDEFVKMSEKDCVYLKKGSPNALRTQSDKAEILEFYWPARLDYVKKAGGTVPKKLPAILPPTSESSVISGEVFNYNSLQFCQPEKNLNVCIIQTDRGQVCFVRMDSDAEFQPRETTEEQIQIVLHGWIDKTINGTTTRMEEGDVVYLTKGMIHGGTVGTEGCDLITVFSPANNEYYEALKEHFEKLHSIIPPDVKPELLVDGSRDEPDIISSEGPSWMHGKLYFSDQGQPGFHVLNSDGSHEVINRDFRSVGTTPLFNGNLAVCYFRFPGKIRRFETGIVEMTPQGEVVRTIVDLFNNAPLGIPNDLVTDKKGGLYFTDSVGAIWGEQPGTAIYYLNPEGKLNLVSEWNEFGGPNGCVLSPDDSRFFLSDFTDNTIWMFDVNDDGTLSNKRLFAKLISGENADGMTIDTAGNLYIATDIGIHIFDKKGNFTGHIYMPVRSTNCVFGGDDLSTLFVTCVDRIYAIKTRMTGFQYPLK